MNDIFIKNPNQTNPNLNPNKSNPNPNLKNFLTNKPTKPHSRGQPHSF
jgi:hypothetical protein